MLNALPPPARSSAVVACVFGGSILIWLCWAAAIVGIEYYDGLSAICNARYFLGDSHFYVFDRGPLMAWLQMPAEAVKQRLGLHPLDVRPHHAAMALIHAAYLAAVYAALVRVFGQQWAVLTAFAAAITTYVFASYAPFLSHDLAPGALLLWMLLWSEDLRSTYRADGTPSRVVRVRLWALLALAGALAPLIKQTYGVFWIAVLGAHLATTLMPGKSTLRSRMSALVPLMGAAATSAWLTWIIYGIVLENWAPNVSLWLRPFRNLQYLASVYDGTNVVFPLWIYARNLWAYGGLTASLLIPGLVLSLRGSALQRRAAVAWIIAVAFVHAMPLREVRYLAFVAPLSAFVIVPAVQFLAARRVVAGAMAVVLALDLSGAAIEASRIGNTFYRQSEFKALIDAVPTEPSVQRPLFFNVSMLSFVAPDPSPLAADRYHRVFHVGEHHLRVLYGYPGPAVRVVGFGAAFRVSRSAPEGSVLLFSNGILARGPTWDARPPVGLEAFVQGLATLQMIALRRGPSGAYYAEPPVDPGAGRPEYLFPVAIVEGQGAFPLQRQADGGLVLTERDVRAPTDRMNMRAFVVQRWSRPQR